MSESGGLDSLLAGVVGEGEGLKAAIPDSWMQGRTAYGGLSSALALHGALALSEPRFPLRTALVAFVGPVAGDCTIDADVLRRGKSSEAVSATVRSGGEVGTQATFLFGRERESAVDASALPMPDVPHHGELPERRARELPTFTQHFDMRLAGGERLASGAKRGELTWWVRFREPGSAPPAVALLALVDALPPAAFCQLPTIGPVSSTSWMLHMLALEPETEDGWWLLRSEASRTAGGFSAQTMTVWNTAGQPVATGGQGIAVYG